MLQNASRCDIIEADQLGTVSEDLLFVKSGKDETQVVNEEGVANGLT